MRFLPTGKLPRMITKSVQISVGCCARLEHSRPSLVQAKPWMWSQRAKKEPGAFWILLPLLGCQFAWKSPRWTLQASCVMHRCLYVREPYSTGFLSRKEGTQRPNPGLPSSGPISLVSSTHGGCRSSLPASCICSPHFGKQAHYPLGDDKDRYTLALPG